MDVAGESFLGRAPAWAKLLVTVAVVVFASLLPRERALWLVVPAGLLGVAWGVARVGVGKVVRRVLVLEPFVLGVALMAFFMPGAWPERWALFGFLVARCSVALVALVLFAATTPFAEMVRVLSRLRVPALLVTTLTLMHRYLFVLADESARMRRARESRTFLAGRRWAWRAGTTVIGQLFLRASERADRIYDAMRARGWGD